jgi:hypothetical protein
MLWQAPPNPHIHVHAFDTQKAFSGELVLGVKSKPPTRALAFTVGSKGKSAEAS